MISNIEVIQNKWGCNKRMADYLIYHEHQCLLGIKDGVYYFTMDDDLKGILYNLPIWMKIVNMLKI